MTIKKISTFANAFPDLCPWTDDPLGQVPTAPTWVQSPTRDNKPITGLGNVGGDQVNAVFEFFTTNVFLTSSIIERLKVLTEPLSDQLNF